MKYVIEKMLPRIDVYSTTTVETIKIRKCLPINSND